MPVSLIPSFLFFAFTSGITPGPANLCSLSAALNYGRDRALKQWRGLFAGFWVVALMSAVVSYFLGNALGTYVRYMSYVGAAYLLWLAWHIWRSSDSGEADAARNCNFWTGFLVNLTNVKVILYCITALGSYVLPYSQSFKSLLGLAVFLPFTGPMCNLVWIFAGTKLRAVFSKYRKPLNAVMALSLVLCAFSIVSYS